MSVGKKTGIIAALLGGALTLYALLGFYLLPYLVQHQLPAMLSEKTGQQVQLQSVRFNPFKFAFALGGFSLSTADAKVLLAFEAFDVNADAWASLTSRAVVLDSVILRKPIVNLERRSDGSLNLGDLAPKKAPSAEEARDDGSVAVAVHRLAIESGYAGWQDNANGRMQTETLSPIDLTISELTTQGESGATLDLVLGIASGGQLKWQGDFEVGRLTSKGHLNLDGLVLSRVWQLFLQDLLPVEIKGGHLSLQADYQASYSESGLALSIVKGAVGVKQLAITEKDQPEVLLTIPSLAVNGIGIDSSKRRVDIAGVTSEDGLVKAWLREDGKINYQALFAKDAGSAAVPRAEDASSSISWQIRLEQLALNRYQVQFADRAQAKPVELRLSDLGIKLKDYSTQTNDKLPLELVTRINDSGNLKVAGDVVIAPFGTELDLELESLDLKPFQTYLDSYLKLELVSGDLSGKGHVSLVLADELQLDFKGDADLANLITRDKVKNKDFLKWSELQLRQIGIDLAKREYGIGKVVFDRPYVRFTINKDKTTNIDDIVIPQLGKDKATQKTAQSKAENPKKQPLITIGKIELKDGNSDFADYSLILPFVAEMNTLNGAVDGFSTAQDTRAKLALKGKVYDMAQVNINGIYQLQNGDSEIALKFRHMPLPLITPYMAEFAGYKIEKGQMALDLQYTIKKGQLEAHNKIFIDQLTLGEHIENPNAVSLPLHLAVALLKDADGKINLDFPITGSLDDPKFSVGSLISDVLVNLVKKVVMSPFKALGSLLDDRQDFSTVVFAAGGAELSAEQVAKLESVGKALQAKPELVLEVKGMAFQDQDWPVMRFDALKDILKKMKSGELRDKGKNIRSEYIELTDDEYKRLLAKFFKEVFPDQIEYSLLGQPRIKAQPDADFYRLAREKLEAVMPPDSQRLNNLAVVRANAIAKLLMEKAGIDNGRIYILAPELDPKGVVGIVSVLSLNVAS